MQENKQLYFTLKNTPEAKQSFTMVQVNTQCLRLKIFSFVYLNNKLQSRFYHLIAVTIKNKNHAFSFCPSSSCHSIMWLVYLTLFFIGTLAFQGRPISTGKRWDIQGNCLGCLCCVGSNVQCWTCACTLPPSSCLSSALETTNALMSIDSVADSLAAWRTVTAKEDIL